MNTNVILPFLLVHFPVLAERAPLVIRRPCPDEVQTLLQENGKVCLLKNHLLFVAIDLYFVVASTLYFSFIVSDFSFLLVINCLMQVW